MSTLNSHSDASIAPLTTTLITDRALWDREVLGGGGHPLQLWGWGEVKESGAWRAWHVRVTEADGSLAGLAQVLVRTLPWPMKSLSYVPRGPVVLPGVDRSRVLRAVTSWAKQTIGGIGISFEPQWDETAVFDLPKSQAGPNPVLLRQTLIIDLTRTEDELMADLSRTTRQGVRRSGRTDLVYREVTDIADFRACLDVYRETSSRAGFALHSDEYYELVWLKMGPHAPLFAAFDGTSPVAFLWLAASDTTSFELYAGANDAGRSMRANYMLKWTAILAMKERGLTEYDVNGLLNDGISDFKRSFAKHENTLVETVDVPFNAWYGIWHKALPTLKSTLRRLKRNG